MTIVKLKPMANQRPVDVGVIHSGRTSLMSTGKNCTKAYKRIGMMCRIRMLGAIEKRVFIDWFEFSVANSTRP